MGALPSPRATEAEPLRVRLASMADLPTRFGHFKIASFVNAVDGKEHVALIKGEVRGARHVRVRLHSECLTGDALGSLRCDCRDQLEAALTAIEAAGCGVLLYLRQEGRGIGIANKVRAYSLQDGGLDTVDANLALGFREDERDYTAAAHMLRALGLGSIELLTNNPDKVRQLRHHGIVVSRRIPHQLPSNPHNLRYLKTKATRSGHRLSFAPRPNGATIVQDPSADQG